MDATATHIPPEVPSLSSKRNRDRELIRYVGRHGAVSIEHVMAALRMGRTVAYRRVAVLIEAGFLARLSLLHAEPSLLCATRAGLRYAGLGLSPAPVSPGSVDHYLRCASTAQLLAEEFGAERILMERELVMWERIEAKPIASARLGERRLHRPDLAVFDEAGTIAIEVELSAKAPRRLAAIMRGWRRASWVAGVRYYCAAGAARRAVERAVLKTHSGERVSVFEVLPR
ncbi:MAG TPA: hypothetical protein VFP23_04370 [Solirubrobacterales bacterium]|nr:hypothetical protein [Solirubrobacterales bacterium]